LKKLAALLVVGVALAGCNTSGSIQAGLGSVAPEAVQICSSVPQLQQSSANLAQAGAVSPKTAVKIGAAVATIDGLCNSFQSANSVNVGNLLVALTNAYLTYTVAAKAK
jgi:hypothetical protein